MRSPKALQNTNRRVRSYTAFAHQLFSLINCRPPPVLGSFNLIGDAGAASLAAALPLLGSLELLYLRRVRPPDIVNK